MPKMRGGRESALGADVRFRDSAVGERSEGGWCRKVYRVRSRRRYFLCTDAQLRCKLALRMVRKKMLRSVDPNAVYGIVVGQKVAKESAAGGKS